MQEEDFAKRLSALRQEKGASARDMSLSLGQNAGTSTILKTDIIYLL